MKRSLYLGALLALSLASAVAQPKVAVLDAVIPQNMDPSVIVPVTEKIAERLVVSGRFIVLDRANIESVLKEREFQVSGMVSDQDVVTAGKYLGADFVVVAKVTKVSDTYFISAKMIAIKTGVIANQTSAQGEGKLSALIDIAEQVGEVLSGGAVLAQSAAGGQKDISKPDGTVAPPPPPPKAKTNTSSAGQAGRSGIVVGFTYEPYSEKYTYYDTYSAYDEVMTEKKDYVGIDIAYEMKYLGLGLSYISSSKRDYSFKVDTASNGTASDEKDSFLGFEAYAKFPIPLGSATLFPYAGAEYQMELGVKDSNGDTISLSSYPIFEDYYSSRLMLVGGLGLDYSILGNLFLRADAAYCFRLFTKNKDAVSKMEAAYYMSDISLSASAIKIALGIGYKL